MPLYFNCRNVLMSALKIIFKKPVNVSTLLGKTAESAFEKVNRWKKNVNNMNSILFKRSELSELKSLVYNTCGINLHEGKLELLKSKVAKRMRMTHMNVQDYLSHLRSNEREVIEFIDTITTNHSFFYRENKSIEYIVKTVRRPPPNGK